MGDREDKKIPGISVIIPVYNVADDIDACLKSVVNQSFPDLEVILIDDGSTDGSDSICDEWEKKDKRIRVIHKENGGVSSARNVGIGEASGKYIAFVDPDDWLDRMYFEKLYLAAERSGADLAECDIWRYNSRTGKKAYRSCSGTMGVPWSEEEHMKYAPTAPYKSISRRDLWIRNNVRFPDCAFESPAVYALIYALAGKRVNVPEALYYYRLMRPGSLIETGYAGKDGKANNTLGTEAMAHLISEFKRLGLYERYKDALEGTVKYRLSDILATQFHRKEEDDYRETVRNFRCFLKETFPEDDRLPGKYISFGGYNLSRILVHLKQLHDPYCRFNFTSIIAVTNENAESLSIGHPNRYRQMMLQREEDQAIWDIIKEVGPDHFFIDLTDERFDVTARKGSGSGNDAVRFITDSDCRKGAKYTCPCESGGMSFETVGRKTDEYRRLFEERSRVFINKIKETVPGIRIVVTENYLCDSYGTPGDLRKYMNAEEIREMNSYLRESYKILEANCPDAVIIRPWEDPEISKWLFTDMRHEHGVEPAHINEIANRKIAALIEKRIGK